MARARNIKPGFFANEELVELPFSTRLLFIGLWTVADKAGRMEDKPKRIKMNLFPADDIDIDKALDELQASGFLIRYEHDSARYIQVLAFSKHQNPHKDEKASIIPSPHMDEQSTVEAPCLHSANPADSLNLIPDTGLLIPDSPIPEKETKSKASASGSRLPADWRPNSADIEYCKTERPDLRVSAVAQNFYDYWIAKAGKDGRKADWSATWRSWVRKESAASAGRGAAPQANDLAETQRRNNEEAARILGIAPPSQNDDGMTIDAN